MSARLVALNGPTDIPLPGLLTVVGRHPDCNVRLNSSRISRRHCCLALGVGEWRVCDLGSTNGIRINGHLVKDGLLRPGDVLDIAHLRFRLVLSDPTKSDVASDRECGPEPDPASLAYAMAMDTALHDLKPGVNEIPRPGPPGEG